MDMTFYSFPWGEPTTAVVEASGVVYDIREGYGCREGWTHDYVALLMSEEDQAHYGNDLLEMTPEEVKEEFDEETMAGIAAAIVSAGGIVEAKKEEEPLIWKYDPESTHSHAVYRCTECNCTFYGGGKAVHGTACTRKGYAGCEISIPPALVANCREAAKLDGGKGIYGGFSLALLREKLPEIGE